MTDCKSFRQTSRAITKMLVDIFVQTSHWENAILTHGQRKQTSTKTHTQTPVSWSSFRPLTAEGGTAQSRIASGGLPTPWASRSFCAAAQRHATSCGRVERRRLAITYQARMQNVSPSREGPWVRERQGQRCQTMAQSLCLYRTTSGLYSTLLAYFYISGRADDDSRLQGRGSKFED